MSEADLSGRLDTVETSLSYLTTQLATRPDLTTFQDYSRGQEQDLDTLVNNYNLIKNQLRSISTLYTNLLNTVTSNLRTFTGHSGNSDIHFSPSIQRTFTGSATLAYNERVAIINNTGGSITMTLPSVSLSSGEFFHIKKIDNSGFTCTITGSVPIDGDLTYLLTDQYESAVLYSNGTTWNVF